MAILFFTIYLLSIFLLSIFLFIVNIQIGIDIIHFIRFDIFLGTGMCCLRPGTYLVMEYLPDRASSMSKNQ